MRRHARFEALDRAVAEGGWKVVGLTRLSPIFPFTLLNYAFGLTKVSLREYVVASWLGMIPGTVLYVYLGALAHLGDDGDRTGIEWVMYGVGLLATLIVTVFITRMARRALAGHVGTDTNGNGNGNRERGGEAESVSHSG